MPAAAAGWFEVAAESAGDGWSAVAESFVEDERSEADVYPCPDSVYSCCRHYYWGGWLDVLSAMSYAVFAPCESDCGQHPYDAEPRRMALRLQSLLRER